MSSQPQRSPLTVVERLHRAMNQHNLDEFVGCFASDYQSEQPLFPDRVFNGSDQVRKNWSSIFASVPDFQSELLRTAVSGDTIWSEWHWRGTRTDDTPFEMRGVIILGIRNDQISWARLYMDSVHADSGDIDATVKDMTHTS